MSENGNGNGNGFVKKAGAYLSVASILFGGQLWIGNLLIERAILKYDATSDHVKRRELEQMASEAQRDAERTRKEIARLRDWINDNYKPDEKYRRRRTEEKNGNGA